MGKGGTGRGGTAQWPLVGRQHELDGVAAALQNPDLSGIVLVGPAGVGKTRLAGECRALAAELGFATVHCVATRAAAAVPFGALAPLALEDGGVAEGMVGLRAAIRARAASRPLLLVVDDAHLLDDPSAAVLHYAALEQAAFLVLTCRPHEPAPDAISTLWKDGLAARFEVPPLSAAETHELAIVMLGGPVDGASAQALHRASGGNPLFVRELVLAGREEGNLVADGGVWRLRGALPRSTRLSELVHARLGALSDDERSVVEHAAVGGRLPVAVLQQVSSGEAVASAERRGMLLVEIDGRRRMAGLVHPLHGEVVRGETGALRSDVVRGALADAVEALGARRRDDALACARWRVESGRPVIAGNVVATARAALGVHDLALAEHLARVAVDRSGDVKGGLVLGQVLLRQGRNDEAEQVLATAASRAATDEERSLVAMARAKNLFYGLDRPDDAVAACSIDVTDPEWRAELVVERSSFVLLAGRPDDAIAAVMPLLEGASGRVLTSIMSVLAPALAVAGRAEEAIALASKGAEHRAALGEQLALDPPESHVVAKALALCESGRLLEAASVADACYRSCLLQANADGQAWAALVLGRVALSRGHAVTARQWFAEARSVFGDAGQLPQLRWALAGIAFASALMGATVDGVAALAELDDLVASVGLLEPDVDRARAWVALSDGDQRGALEFLRGAAASAAATGQRSLEVAALHDLLRAGASGAADQVASAAASVQGPLAVARAEHSRALSADDADALDAAAAAFAGVGADLSAAEAAAAAARLHAGKGRRRAAASSATFAADAAARCEGAANPAFAVDGRAGLTEREREIAALAGAGLSSRAIADRLYLSIRTVDNHLQRAYRKLGVKTRHDLTEALGAR